MRSAERLASPAPRPSRCSLGVIQGLLAAREPHRAAFERRCIRAGPLRSALLFVPIAGAMRSAERLASPAPRPSRCSLGVIQGLLAAREPHRAAFEWCCIRSGSLRSALLLVPIAGAMRSAERLASPAHRRSRCALGVIHGLLAALQTPPSGIRAALYPFWIAALCVAPCPHSWGYAVGGAPCQPGAPPLSVRTRRDPRIVGSPANPTERHSSGAVSVLDRCALRCSLST